MTPGIMSCLWFHSKCVTKSQGLRTCKKVIFLLKMWILCATLRRKKLKYEQPLCKSRKPKSEIRKSKNRKPKTENRKPKTENQNSSIMALHEIVRRVTTHVLHEMKLKKEKIAMLTAYDFSIAHILDEAGIDVILVGDSASNVMAGHETTIPITLEEMIYHAKSVVRGVKRALCIVDLPFGTYQGNSIEALSTAIRIMKETGAHGIKMEGGKEIEESVVRILSAGIPVMGHLGLTPQSIHKFGTYVVRARDEKEAEKLVEDAKLLQELGCFAVVLEKIPAKLGEKVAKILTIPVIGIGAGPNVDGQVLVLHDMLGITQEFSPRFLRRYHNLHAEIKGAVENYISDVRSVDFPNDKEQY